MQFVSLSKTLLVDLQTKGYNILTSKNTVDDENPTWYPITVPDVWAYLLALDSNNKKIPLQEPAILVIEDALQNIEDEQFIGQVFLEDDHQQKLQQRLFVYNEHYKFDINSDKFNFAYDPIRVLLRNHALHSGDQLQYIEYLRSHYPKHIEGGIQDLETLTRQLIYLDADQVSAWIKTNKVAIFESDICIYDQDAILRPVPAFDTVQNHPVVEGSGSLIYNQMAVEDLLQLRAIFWIDPRVG